jgi:hypothetical protein
MELVNWIHLAQYRDQWQAFENTVMNIQVPLKMEISWLAEQLLASQEGLCSMELVNWVHLAQDTDQWQALVNIVMNLQVP